MEGIMYFFPAMGVIALLFVIWRSSWVSKQEVGTDKMAGIADHISKGAMAFLKAEYKVLIIFVIALAVILAFKGSAEENSHPLVALSFVVGAFCSAFAGFLGMRVAT
ncbi:MAG: sodium/proton-translocating pyrophosphatase, partial [Cyclobacteriaceae bacterium]|nr:sodium/proton-translocating pyrophosphatase [Cyclobacteriaceae bacterium]